MRLTEEDNIEIHNILSPYEFDEKVLEMKHFFQHGIVTTYEHVMNVTRVSYYLNKKWNLKLNKEDLVTGAFLHDFYLYDWHAKDNNSHRFHGFRHPYFASKNAVKYFNVNKKVENIIKSHMWPLTIFSFPLSREALLVSFVDKICSLIETVFYRNRVGVICG
ncbi:MAG: HD domain-containing protein [Treponemataceae bacterium]|nr:HD domain-containing protein [Treponemataceae bacterium]